MATKNAPGVFVSVVPYRGWNHNLWIRNERVELLITLDVGPRILRYGPLSGPNVFAELEEELGGRGEPDWKSRGGHRFWLAPERRHTTYRPDNEPVSHEIVDASTGRVRVSAYDPEIGVEKQLEVELAPDSSGVTVLHRLCRRAPGTIEVSPWGLTVMARGGRAIVPLPAKRPHPSDIRSVRSDADFWPDQALVMWPFFDFHDPRLAFGSRYLVVEQRPGSLPTKFGLIRHQSFLAYLHRGLLFTKRVLSPLGDRYPDLGCNVELFTNADMLELETLGPFSYLSPEECVEHIEYWELHQDVPPLTDEESIDRWVAGHLRTE